MFSGIHVPDGIEVEEPSTKLFWSSSILQTIVAENYHSNTDASAKAIRNQLEDKMGMRADSLKPVRGDIGKEIDKIHARLEAAQKKEGKKRSASDSERPTAKSKVSKRRVRSPELVLQSDSESEAPPETAKKNKTPTRDPRAIQALESDSENEERPQKTSRTKPCLTEEEKMKKSKDNAKNRKMKAKKLAFADRILKDFGSVDEDEDEEDEEVLLNKKCKIIVDKLSSIGP